MCLENKFAIIELQIDGNKYMKKNGFMEGAVIATLGIVFVKIIGVLYVIPFYSLVGEKGGALYGYAYTIYQLFLGISTAGFPFAISKITSEYNTLNNKNAIKKTYSLSLKLILTISIVVFLVLFIFAPQIGKIIVGNVTDGNTYSDIAFVVRMISFSILVVPFLSVTKGLLQGHKYITPTTNSQIIEQIVRVIIIVGGSYLALKVFDLGMTKSVGIAVSGAFAGGLVAYLYLKRKIRKIDLLNTVDTKEEPKIENKEIIKKIIGYSIPFILISLVYNLYNTTDMILVSRTLSDILHRKFSEVESILSIYTTWGLKLNMILLSVSTGLNTSLTPNIVSSYVKKDMNDVNSKFNKALQCILLVIVPMTLFLSILSKPIWTLFYGASYYGPKIYKYFAFTSLFGSAYVIMVNTLQGLSKYKLVVISVISGLLLNIVLDIPLMLLFNKIGLEPTYGAILSTVMGYSVSIFISLYILKNKYNFDFNDTGKRILKYVFSWITFILAIELLKLFVPTTLTGRVIQIPILTLYGIVSFAIYIVINFYNGNLKNVFGEMKIFKKVEKFLLNSNNKFTK